MAKKQTANKPSTNLSQRELCVLKLYAKFAKKKIADLLCIDYETVKTHLKNCVKKLQAKQSRHALYMAMRRRLI
ncbi:MAG TPA: LuxR C-terminal-related transcriptional regulator [Bacteroidia bacterium]